MEVRRYGTKGPDVVVLHGGPGAPGSAEPLARALAARARVAEPMQRARTVAGHVADLHDVAKGLDRPLLVGWSWGAMLALAYAAEHPVAGLFLVGCGTFDEVARAELRRIRAARMDGPEPQTFEEWGEVTLRTDSYELAPFDPPDVRLDPEAGIATWEDMMRLQKDGTYPAAFASIACPVLLVHGDHDPHPGRLVRDGLLPCLPQLEYAEIPRCGHYPWFEAHGRKPFFKRLFDWVDKNAV